MGEGVTFNECIEYASERTSVTVETKTRATKAFVGNINSSVHQFGVFVFLV